jgi:signal transduction histidine kinase
MITQLLRSIDPAARGLLAPFLVAIPVADVIAGLTAAALTAALTRYIELSIDTARSAQRSAAASERSRLARELHDSVAKTLRGVSFAAVALPSALRRHPDLAEQLAATVSTGAETAQREARELLSALRRDMPDRPFVDTVQSVCAEWAAAGDARVALDLARVEPTLAARYELTQILSEALRNVAQHARATLVEVGLTRTGERVRLTVRDNGAGFTPPADLSGLSAGGSFGVVGMFERARSIGGQLSLTSHPGCGTTVVATAPSAVLIAPEGAGR